jgi:hypothetical protein
MTAKLVRRIVALILEAQELAASIGIPNLLQPGLVKELIVAEALGHQVIYSKRDADAYDREDPSARYEYLSCKEGGSFQIDRMFKRPPEKRAQSLARITRNRRLYFAVFDKKRQLELKTIYELAPAVVLAEAERQLDRSRNEISHISFPIVWGVKHGKVVYDAVDGHS